MDKLQLTHSQFPKYVSRYFFFLLSGNEDKPKKPHFDSRSLIFELDPCNGNGKVCLVYRHTKPGETDKKRVIHLFLKTVAGRHMHRNIKFRPSLQFIDEHLLRHPASAELSG